MATATTTSTAQRKERKDRAVKEYTYVWEGLDRNNRQVRGTQRSARRFFDVDHVSRRGQSQRGFVRRAHTDNQLSHRVIDLGAAARCARLISANRWFMPFTTSPSSGSHQVPRIVM